MSKTNCSTRSIQTVPDTKIPSFHQCFIVRSAFSDLIKQSFSFAVDKAHHFALNPTRVTASNTAIPAHRTACSPSLPATVTAAVVQFSGKRLETTCHTLETPAIAADFHSHPTSAVWPMTKSAARMLPAVIPHSPSRARVMAVMDSVPRRSAAPAKPPPQG